MSADLRPPEYLRSIHLFSPILEYPAISSAFQVRQAIEIFVLSRPSPTQLPVSNDQPRMSISSIVNPPSGTVIGSEFDSASGFGQPSAQVIEQASIWPSYTGLCDYYSNPNYQTSQEFLSTPCGATMDYSFQDRITNSPSYDYSFPVDYNIEAMSLACPRSYQTEFGMAPVETMVPPTEAYPPSSYLMDPRKHQPYMAISPRPIESGGLLVEQDQEMPNRIQIGYGTEDSLNSCASPTSSSRLGNSEIHMSPGGGKDRASEEGDPPSTIGDDADGGEDEGNQPYAQLIYRALMSTPDHKMVLNEIYDWFRNTFEKFNKAKGKGWQNSIRHNLSMNGAFTKVGKSDDSAKGFIWVLEPSAIREGVKSTTRYRKGIGNKKTRKSETPSPQRLATSGRRTGKSTKKTWKSKRVKKSEKVAAASMELERRRRAEQTGVCFPAPLEGDPSTWPYADGTPAPLTIASQQQHIKQENPPFLFQDIVGVSTPYSGEPFFCELSSDVSGAPPEYSSSNDSLTNPFFSSQEM
ncbi:hypothetical protein GP486_003081 [Trichoglossum hirsutum]|uniref:Fork-head domain-containing protein n=1 Tax=Trichoglossum hirsutum TaxID=265104 RepID=A0A9P8RRH5_9PEZI|nr:hypothetical protein GP486_003081 [Trichoglossum hirsutum]